MRKLEKAGRARHTYKMGDDESNKDTFVTLEVGEKSAADSQTEFTGNASLRQMVCLLPAEGTAQQ